MKKIKTYTGCFDGNDLLVFFVERPAKEAQCKVDRRSKHTISFAHRWLRRQSGGDYKTIPSTKTRTHNSVSSKLPDHLRNTSLVQTTSNRAGLRIQHARKKYSHRDSCCLPKGVKTAPPWCERDTFTEHIVSGYEHDKRTQKHHLLHQACTSCSQHRQRLPHPSKRAHPPVVQQRQSPRRIPLLGALMQSMRQRRRSSVMGYKNPCSSATPRTCTSPSDGNETTSTRTKRSRVTVRHVDVHPGPHMQVATCLRQSQAHRTARRTTGTGFPWERKRLNGRPLSIDGVCG